MLSAHFVPGNVPGGDTKMSKTVLSLRESTTREGGRGLNTVNVVSGEKGGVPDNEFVF